MENKYIVYYDDSAVDYFCREIDAKGYILKFQAEKERFLENAKARYKAQTEHCDSYWWKDSLGQKHLAYLSSLGITSNEQLAKRVEESRVLYEKAMRMRIEVVR